MEKTQQNEWLERIREAINSKHKRALQALEDISQYLSDLNPVFNPKDNNRQAPEVSLFDDSDSYRSRVLAVLTDHWQNLGELERTSGLDKKKLRGVLYAKNMGGRVERKRIDGQVKFRLQKGKT